MKKQFLRSRIAAAAGLARLAALSMVPSAGAQNYGPWSPPVNLNNVVLSDNTHCPAVVNSAFNDTPRLSKDGLSLYFASTRPGGSGDYDLWVTERNSL